MMQCARCAQCAGDTLIDPTPLRVVPQVQEKLKTVSMTLVLFSAEKRCKQ